MADGAGVGIVTVGTGGDTSGTVEVVAVVAGGAHGNGAHTCGTAGGTIIAFVSRCASRNSQRPRWTCRQAHSIMIPRLSGQRITCGTVG